MLYGLILSIILCGIAICICNLFLERNDKVADEKKRVLEIVSNLSQDDIENGLEWKWRYDEYQKITYEKMFFQFWKPVDSFYKNHPCLKKHENDILQKLS